LPKNYGQILGKNPIAWPPQSFTGLRYILQMRFKAIVILFIILAALVPVYSLNNYLQKIIQPRKSLGRLFLYLFSGMFVVFIFVLVVVLLIRLVFPGA
jgi:hypothetical protein